MNKKQLRYSYNEVLNAAESLKCEDLLHLKSEQHEAGWFCPAEDKLYGHVETVRRHMKEVLK